MIIIKRSKILAPSRGLEMTKRQIESGADEIYLGVENKDFNIYSFSGRFNTMNGVRVQLPDYEELQKNIDYCKSKNVELQLTANIHYIPETMKEDYMDYVKTCAEMGIDQLIVSNIGLIKEIRKRNIDVPIVAGSFTFIPNSEQVKFLRDMGVFRVVLPHATSISEIADIKKKVPDIELEIFALIGGGNNCGRCMMFHSPTKKDIGPGCRAMYKVNYDGQIIERNKFLDAAADCGLCSVKELMEAGVDSLKIVGRESKNEIVASKFTDLFYKFREGILAGKSVSEIKSELEKTELMWQMNWKPRFCERQKCKFHNTPVTKSYI